MASPTNRHIYNDAIYQILLHGGNIYLRIFAENKET